MTPLNQTGADLSFDPLSPMSCLDRSAEAHGDRIGRGQGDVGR
jgi:hypothetical protein